MYDKSISFKIVICDKNNYYCKKKTVKKRTNEILLLFEENCSRGQGGLPTGAKRLKCYHLKFGVPPPAPSPLMFYIPQEMFA